MTGDELRSALDQAGITPARFAEQLGVSRNTVYRWIHESLPVPQYATGYLSLLREVADAITRLQAISHDHR